MSTTLSPPIPSFAWPPPIKLLTIADVAAMPRSLPSGDVKYELDDGRLIVLPLPGDIHGAIQATICSSLMVNGQARGLGKARGGVGLILRRNRDRLTVPDAVFITNASLPIRRSSEGYLETIPELVIEVRSPNETGPAVLSKVNEYLMAGVVVVWVIDPAAQIVTAYRRNRDFQIFGIADVLTVHDVIPGFQVPVAELFQE